MTRLDRLLKLLEEYDDLAAVAIGGGLYGLRYGKEVLPYLRKEKEKLTQEFNELYEYWLRTKENKL